MGRVRARIQGNELIQSWFPQAERLSVPDAGHPLMVQNPAGLAGGLRDFFAGQRSPASPGAWAPRATLAVSAAGERSGTR